MMEICPDHSVLGPARLDGYRLAFTRRSAKTGTGVADIVADLSSAVWGALYDISEECASQLDRKEGHPWAYARRDVHVHLNGVAHEAAFTYAVSQPEDDEVPPSETYIESMIEGARERSLPSEYVAFLESLRKRWPERPSN
jgi:gamma-glutamylcyclotransferase (GGCT)/AIG2-like uncharacterized protein YtfP